MASFNLSIPLFTLFNLKICTDDNLLTSISYDNNISDNQLKLSLSQNTDYLHSEVEQEVIRQLKAYVDDPNYQFTLPLSYKGATVFQIKVWSALFKIPMGTTLTYSELALIVNSGARAVANACRQNRFPIIIPCHRVVSKNGLGGYDGDNRPNQPGTKLAIKCALLKHEGVNV